MESEKDKKIGREDPAPTTLLTPDDLDGLLPKYITTREELNDAEFRNTAEATKKYFLSRRKLEFTLSGLYQVHKDMFGQVWKWAGKKRLTNKNIGIDKVEIDVELQKLVDDFHFWKSRDFDLIEISARMHHRLVYIHPFNNGNGRWARFIVNLFLIEHLDSYLDFPEDDLILTTTVRKNYIRALKQADVLNYKPLIHFHNKYLSPFSEPE